jgi:hypothetical protein
MTSSSVYHFDPAMTIGRGSITCKFMSFVQSHEDLNNHPTFTILAAEENPCSDHEGQPQQAPVLSLCIHKTMGM